jgi:serine/threonine-protein kinase
MGYYATYYDLTSGDVEMLQVRYNDFGWSGVGRFMINKLEAMSKDKYVSPSNMSIFYVMLKNHARALDYLEKAYENRSAQMVYIGVQAEFDSLHAEPRFQALLKKIGLPK